MRKYDFPLPLRVCIPCGNLYRQRPGSGIGITVSMDECAVCGEQKMCAPDYDFGGLRDDWKNHRVAPPPSQGEDKP